MTPIILASASATRANILRSAGVAFTAVEPDVDEEGLKAILLREGAAPDAIAGRLAEAKAAAVSEQAAGLVIGADQTLELGGELLSKVRGATELKSRLLALRGKRHKLHTAVAVAQGGPVIWRTLQSAELSVRAFSDAFLDAYLARNGVSLSNSLCGYELEHEGAQLFDRIDGDYFAILGLPLVELCWFLRSAGGLQT